MKQGTGYRVRGMVLLLVCTLLLTLGGCGRKPADVDPPEGADTRAYPRTYPSPATDPEGRY